jgi:hypothetical protein
MKKFYKYLRVSVFCFLFGLPLSLMAQRQITGTVTTGANSSPLANASVTVKGTSIGTTSDAGGRVFFLRRYWHTHRIK